MTPDTDKIDEAVLALLYLTLHDVNEFGGSAWKSHDWDALNRLHEKGFISDPKSKAKSVILAKKTSPPPKPHSKNSSPNQSHQHSLGEHMKGISRSAVPTMLVVPFLFMLFLCPLVTHASIAAPNSSAAISKDGSKILVMLSPDPGFDNTPTATLPDGRVINLHDRFTKSGVYDASTLRPISQVDWFSLSWALRYSGDFRYVVRINRFGQGSPWAIAFYDRGVAGKTYSCNTLLTGMKSPYCLPFTTSDYHSVWYDRIGLNSSGDKLLLSTARRQTYFYGHTIDLGLQEFYTFDLATDDMLSKRVTGRWIIWAYVAVTLLILILAPIVAFLGLRKICRLLIASRTRRGFPVTITSDSDKNTPQGPVPEQLPD